MSIRPEEALKAKALAASPVTSLIGSGSSARWYANAAPARVAYPCIVADVNSVRPVNHFTGGGWAKTEIALRIYGVEQSNSKSGYEVCQDVADALRNAMNSTKATVTVGVETCLPTIILQSQSDTPAGIVEGTDKPVFGITQNWLVSMAQPES